MRKFYPLILLTVLFAAGLQAECNSCDCTHSSKSYLFIRPQFQSASPELVSGFRDDRIRARENGHCSAFQVTVFGGRSTNDQDIARYFLPNCETSITVDSQLAEKATNGSLSTDANGDTKPIDKDVLASHFGIFTISDPSDDRVVGKFRSRVCFEPEQTTAGVGFHYRTTIYENQCSRRGIWGSISFPVMRVSTTMGIREEIIETDSVDKELFNNLSSAFTDSTAPQVHGNMIDAFNQTSWKFGRICKGRLNETRVGDIELKLGYEWLQRCPCHLESYVGFLAPTGTHPNNKYMFEPVVGNGHRWGVMFGSAGGIDLWGHSDDEDCDIVLRMEFTTNSLYLFSEKYCRSLDLKCRPWSRYMQLYKDKQQADEARAAELLAIDGGTYNNPNSRPAFRQARHLFTPGINLLSVPVKVSGGFINNGTTAFVLRCHNFEAEFGYNLYARNAECVDLACDWKEGPAIKHFLGGGRVNPIRDITGNPLLDDPWGSEPIGQTNPGVLATVNPNIPAILVATNAAQTGNANVTLAFNNNSYDRAVIKESDLDLKSAASPCVFTQTLYGAVGYMCNHCDRPLYIHAGGSYEVSQSNAAIKRWTAWGKIGLSF